MIEWGEMSAIGPKRTSLVAPHMSAFGGKADICRFALHMSAFDPKRTWARRDTQSWCCALPRPKPLTTDFADRSNIHVSAGVDADVTSWLRRNRPRLTRRSWLLWSLSASWLASAWLAIICG